MVSLVGRLGGINHISRAFVLALITAVLLIPWQMLGLNVLGVTWTPEELLRWLPTKGIDLWNTIIFYLRFSYWAAVTLLVLLAGPQHLLVQVDPPPLGDHLSGMGILPMNSGLRAKCP
jgi:hypothetical protein